MGRERERERDCWLKAERKERNKKRERERALNAEGNIESGALKLRGRETDRRTGREMLCVCVCVW